jgi:RNA polymerase sigma factor (sigma-70 family)
MQSWFNEGRLQPLMLEDDFPGALPQAGMVTRLWRWLALTNRKSIAPFRELWLNAAVATSSHTVPPPDTPHRSLFVTTHWSTVVRAGHGDTEQAREALEKLCRTYWYPIYAWIRRRGHSPEDAQDLTQSFFLRLLEQESLAKANPELGRFRSFLLGALNHFLIDEWKKARTQRRGSGRQILSLDWAAAEQRFDLEPVDHATPYQAFDRNWATALLEEVLNQLEEEYKRDGKLEMFRALKQTLTGVRESQPYASLAERLGIAEGALRVAVHRLRKRYRALLEAEIANTVSSPGEVKEEMAYLLQTIAGD